MTSESHPGSAVWGKSVGGGEGWRSRPILLPDSVGKRLAVGLLSGRDCDGPEESPVQTRRMNSVSHAIGR